MSISQRFIYFLQLSPPSLVEPVAEWLDGEMWRYLERCCGFRIPRKREPGAPHINIPLEEYDQSTYQEWVVRLPVRLYGWGFRSLKDIAGPAYIGALETAVPFMAGRGEAFIAPQMAEVWGGEDRWGIDSPWESRWTTLLESECDEGKEVNNVWRKLQREYLTYKNWIGLDYFESLDSSVEGIGEGSVSGETKGKILECMENARAKALSKALENVRPVSTRAAWAWRQRDKISCAWLLALPGSSTHITNAEFSEAAAANLCLPSPACAERIGEVIRGRVCIDEYGDNIQSTSLPGDHWRTRHDSIKHLLHRLCLWSGLPVEMEVFNLFSGLVRQEGWSRIERARQRQTLVPDMRITMLDPAEGVTRPILHEVKVISANKSRYHPNSETRAVDLRSSKLQHEYIVKARGADRLGGVETGEVGRVESKLVSLGSVRGVVCGNWGEVSEDTHALLHTMAVSRVRVAGPSVGKRGVMRSETGEMAIVMGYLRRTLSVATIKAQCSSLLGRIEGLGPGAAAAVNRRRQAAELDRQARLEQRAHALSVRQGWAIYRSGFAKTN